MDGAIEKIAKSVEAISQDPAIDEVARELNRAVHVMDDHLRELERINEFAGAFHGSFIEFRKEFTRGVNALERIATALESK